MRTTTVFGLAGALLVTWVCGASAGTVSPDPADGPGWYQVSFTGADLWAHSPDAITSPAQQTQPRAFVAYDPEPPFGIVQRYTTYGPAGTSPYNGTYGGWLAGGALDANGNPFAFQAINLWGEGGPNAANWGETYIADAWKLVSAPPGWVGSIVNLGGPAGAGTSPDWQWNGTPGTEIGPNTPNLSSFVFTFDVLIQNPSAAIMPGGYLRMFFGGFDDDYTPLGMGTGPDNNEGKGAIPEVDGAVYGLVTMMLSVGSLFVWRRKAK